MERKEKMKMKKSALRLFWVMISACLLLPVGMTACSSDEETCYSGIILDAGQTSFVVRVLHSPEENTITPQVGSLVIFPKENISLEYKEGDEISFIIKKFEKIIPEGITTGFPFKYSCIVEPCK